MNLNLEQIRQEAKRLKSLSPSLVSESISELTIQVQVLTHLLDRLHNGEPIQWRGKWIKVK